MSHLVAWPVFLPLILGFLLLFARWGGLGLQRSISFIGVLGLILLSVSLLEASAHGERQVYLLGNWIAPFGIVLVLDQLSAMMIFITAVLAAAALWYAISTKVDQKGAHFHVLYQMQLFGLNGAFLTGDVFNLFVFFEVLLLASYGLLLHGRGRKRTKAGLHYVVINLIGSTLFLFAVGALYGALGTLNLADMAAKIAIMPADNLGLVAAAGLLLLVVFGIKAAMFPLYLWLPSAYANTSAPVAALFAIMTKVGIYAIIRVHGTIFGSAAGELAFFHSPWVLALGLITLFLAALGVLAARGFREQVAYLVLASVATLLIAIGLQTAEALSAGLYYLIHSTFIAGGLFLLADVISRGRGDEKDLFVSGTALPNAIFVGSVFMFGAIAITGLPPLSGFFGKLLILESALNHSWFWVILTVVLLASLWTIIALARSGSLLFYKVTSPSNTQPLPNLPNTFNWSAFMAILILFSASPLLVIFALPISQFTESMALQQWDVLGYIQAVMSAIPVSPLGN